MAQSQSPQSQAPLPPPLKKSLRRMQVKRYLVTGLIAILPLLVTVYILNWGLQFIHSTIGATISKVAESILGSEKDPYHSEWANFLHGVLISRAFADVLGLVLFVALLFVVGMMLGTFVGRQLFDAFEKRVARLPMVRIIYPLVRQVTEFFTNRKQRQFGRVVAVEYPRKGIYSVAFVTSEGVEDVRDRNGRQMICVFVPNAPSPVTGWVLFCPEEEVLPLSMTVDEAFRLLLSGGVVVPRRRLPDAAPLAEVASQSASEQSSNEQSKE